MLARSQPPASRSRLIMPADSAKNSILIYVVDDNPLLGEVTAQIINTAGYQTRMFTNPIEANGALEKGEPKPQVLVTDFDLGKLVGFDLINTTRENIPGIKPLLVSGTVDREVLAKHPVQPDKFIPKPLKADDIIGGVEELLAG